MEDWEEFSEEGELLEGKSYEEGLRLTENVNCNVEVGYEEKDCSFAKGLVSLRPTVTEAGVKQLVKQLEDEYCFRVQFGAIDRNRVGVYVPEGYSKIRQEWIKETLDYYTPPHLKIDMVEADVCCPEYFEIQWKISDDLLGLFKGQRGDKIPHTVNVRGRVDKTLKEFEDEGLIETYVKDHDNYSITVHGKGAAKEVEIKEEIK